VLKWLRCEGLSDTDRARIGDLVARPMEEAPLKMIAELGRLMRVLHGAALVFCVDQLEDMQDLGDPDCFRKAVDSLVAIADQVPSAVVVVSCLEDFYSQHKEAKLARPKRDRLERDPDPIRLGGKRSLDEIEAIIGRRVAHLFEELGVPHNPG